MPVVDHFVGLGNDVENAIGLRFNVVDSFSLLIVSTALGFKDSAVMTDFFISTETGLFILGFALLHDDVESITEAAVFTKVAVRSELGIGCVSGVIVTHAREAEIESLLTFCFFFILEVNFAASSC